MLYHHIFIFSACTVGKSSTCNRLHSSQTSQTFTRSVAALRLVVQIASIKRPAAVVVIVRDQNHARQGPSITMTHISSLPLAAVKRVVQLTQHRRVAGTNKFARVSRQWRAADGSEDMEPLQLLLDWPHMSDEELANALTWMSMHGYQVDALVIQADVCTAQQLQRLWQPAAALTRLRHLEVVQLHSLPLLAPVLGQLPQLQHLDAFVALKCEGSAAGDLDTTTLMPQPSNKLLDSVFSNQDGCAWQDVPHLQQLCPRLVSLKLKLGRLP
jgi:hypothetical protein